MFVAATEPDRLFPPSTSEHIREPTMPSTSVAVRWIDSPEQPDGVERCVIGLVDSELKPCSGWVKPSQTRILSLEDALRKPPGGDYDDAERKRLHKAYKQAAGVLKRREKAPANRVKSTPSKSTSMRRCGELALGMVVTSTIEQYIDWPGQVRVHPVGADLRSSTSPPPRPRCLALALSCAGLGRPKNRTPTRCSSRSDVAGPGCHPATSDLSRWPTRSWRPIPKTTTRTSARSC